MNLSAWLAHIATVHPREMELGLKRVSRVAGQLGLEKPAPAVISIAGTNGKGSTVAAIDAILQNLNLRTGSYMSPHLHRFNERIRLSGSDCEDSMICAAFQEIENARGRTSLSYFEFATLAALWIFAESEPDAVILEVGLGGRLDAVNIVDPDVAVITNVELDHQDWLGNTRELIGAEKAGILRSGAPLVYGEEQPPASVSGRARELGVRVFCRESEYGAIAEARGWCWWGQGLDDAVRIDGLELPKLPLPAMATALQAVHLLPLPVTSSGIRAAQHGAGLPGRTEMRRDEKSGALVLLDVAHNPAAARLLAASIGEWRAQFGQDAKVVVVLALLADKDIEAVAVALEAQVDVWYISEVENSRAMPAPELSRRLRKFLSSAEIVDSDTVAEAYRKASCSGANLVVVTGSFHTVAAVRPLTTAGLAAPR